MPYRSDPRLSHSAGRRRVRDAKEALGRAEVRVRACAGVAKAVRAREERALAALDQAHAQREAEIRTAIHRQLAAKPDVREVDPLEQRIRDALSTAQVVDALERAIDLAEARLAPATANPLLIDRTRPKPPPKTLVGGTPDYHRARAAISRMHATEIDQAMLDLAQAVESHDRCKQDLEDAEVALERIEAGLESQ